MSKQTLNRQQSSAVDSQSEMMFGDGDILYQNPEMMWMHQQKQDERARRKVEAMVKKAKLPPQPRLMNTDSNMDLTNDGRDDISQKENKPKNTFGSRASSARSRRDPFQQQREKAQRRCSAVGAKQADRRP